ncbi:MAG TPA: hypothetical protein VGE85_10015 [Terracidiphilus sp.]|jgi:hypothetical protein
MTIPGKPKHDSADATRAKANSVKPPQGQFIKPQDHSVKPPQSQFIEPQDQSVKPPQEQ